MAAAMGIGATHVLSNWSPPQSGHADLVSPSFAVTQALVGMLTSNGGCSLGHVKSPIGGTLNKEVRGKKNVFS